MDLTRLTLGERIVLGAGVVLLIDLVFLPWYSIDIGRNIPGLDTTQTAVQAPHSGWGLLALMVTLVMVAQIVIAKLLAAALPEPPIPWTQVHLIGAGVVLAALVIKLISDTDFLAFGCFLGLLLAAGLVFGAYTMSQEAAV